MSSSPDMETYLEVARREIGQDIFYGLLQRSLENDNQLFMNLREAEAKRAPHQLQATMLAPDLPISPRNETLAPLMRPSYTLDQFDRIMHLLHDSDLLRLPLHDASIVVGNEAIDIRTISATSRETGGQMSGCLWVRDQTLCARTLLREFVLTGTSESRRYSRDLVLSQLHIMSSPAQLNRFEQIIEHHNDIDYVQDPHNWPHIFLHYDNLNATKTEGWPHKQDAWQMVVVTTFDALRSGVITTDDLTASHKKFLGYCVPFLTAIDYSTNENSGSWEEIEALRSSTLAWEVTAISRCGEWAQKPGFEFLKQEFQTIQSKLPKKSRMISFENVISSLTNQGLEKLSLLFPFESGCYSPDDSRYRQADAALQYLLDLEIPQLIAQKEHPHNSLIQQQSASDMEGDILRQLLSLNDPTTGGMRRYGDKHSPHDSYQGGNFWTNATSTILGWLYGTPQVDGDTSRTHHFDLRNKIIRPGHPASWTHFVHQLASFYSRKYIETGDEQHYKLAQSHINRSLALITGTREYSVMAHDGKFIIQQIPPFRMPEAYVKDIDPCTGEIMTFPSPNTPLNWSIAELRQALAAFRICIEIRTSNYKYSS
jgi:hypothetical protein